jgi:hypothetical protein
MNILLPAVMDKDVYPQHSWFGQVQQRQDYPWVCQGHLGYQPCDPALDRWTSAALAGNIRGQGPVYGHNIRLGSLAESVARLSLILQ